MSACYVNGFFFLLLTHSYGHRTLLQRRVKVKVEMEETMARLRTERNVFVCKIQLKREKKNFLHILTSFLITPLKHSTNENNCDEYLKKN